MMIKFSKHVRKLIKHEKYNKTAAMDVTHLPATPLVPMLPTISVASVQREASLVQRELSLQREPSLVQREQLLEPSPHVLTPQPPALQLPSLTPLTSHFQYPIVQK
jgi:hypothetical protein